MPEIAPRQLILTIYGLYAREEHNWLSVSSVVKLMSDLDVDHTGVRSSISRLKRRGVLEAMKIDRAAGYALSPTALEVIREGDVRIFSRKRALESDGLVLVVFSIPEKERDKRHTLRTALSGLGCGTAAPGVWVAPETLRSDIAQALERLELAQYVDLFEASHVGYGSLRERISRWWDLEAIDAEYTDFIARHEGAQEHWRASGKAARAAFEIYVPMLTEWRRLPYRDPGLPLELLPENWSGQRAGDLFADLDALLRTPAREHALTTIHA